MFFVSWSVSVFHGGFFGLLLSNKSIAKNIAREWRRGKHTYRRVAISPYAPSSPNNTPPVSMRHYTGNVRDKQADKCSPMSRRLVCDVLSGFPVKLCEDLAWLVTNHAARWGGRRVSWRRRTAVTAHQWMAVISPLGVLTGFPLGQDQVLDEDRMSVIDSTILSRPVRRQIFLTFVFSFVLVGFVCYS